jgi:hypothetical protein
MSKLSFTLFDINQTFKNYKYELREEFKLCKKSAGISSVNMHYFKD